MGAMVQNKVTYFMLTVMMSDSEICICTVLGSDQ